MLHICISTVNKWYIFSAHMGLQQWEMDITFPVTAVALSVSLYLYYLYFTTSLTSFDNWVSESSHAFVSRFSVIDSASLLCPF